MRITDDTKGKLGRGKARNDAASESDADWIFFLDADDRMHPDALRVMHDYLDYQAVWGSIMELSGGVGVWRYQVPRILSYQELIAFDPYLTLQMGHFVRRDAFVGFDEEMNCGEDWKYYLDMWRSAKCIKIDQPLFLNHRGDHSTGPKSATGAEWTRVVGELIRQARSE